MSVVFLTMSTLSTSLAGIFGIHRFYMDANTFGFIFNECAELEERPPRHFSTLRLAKPFLVLAYAFQVFKGNGLASVFSLLNDAFGNDMVGISAKPALSAGE